LPPRAQQGGKKKRPKQTELCGEDGLEMRTDIVPLTGKGRTTGVLVVAERKAEQNPRRERRVGIPQPKGCKRTKTGTQIKGPVFLSRKGRARLFSSGEGYRNCKTQRGLGKGERKELLKRETRRIPFRREE